MSAQKDLPKIDGSLKGELLKDHKLKETHVSAWYFKLQLQLYIHDPTAKSTKVQLQNYVHNDTVYDT